MQEKILQYLRTRSKPATSAEVLSSVLKIHEANAAVADGLVASLVKDEKAVIRTNDGRWRAAPVPDSGTQERGLVLCTFLPERVATWEQWTSLGYIRFAAGAKAEKVIRNWHPGSPDRVRSFETMLRFIGREPIVLSGFGNQLSRFRSAAFQLLGREPENPILTLRRLGKCLFPEAEIRQLADLSHLLGLPILTEAEMEPYLETLAEHLETMLHRFHEWGADTWDALEELCTEPNSIVDLSPYKFDESFLDELSSGPGVYVMRDRQGRCIYVGKARNLRRRVRSYFAMPPDEDEKSRSILATLHDLEIRETGSELEALLLEYRLIRQFDPPLNTQLRVHRRGENRKARYPQILVLPAANGESVMLYFLHPQRGLQEIPLLRDGSNRGDVAAKVRRFFFEKPHPPAREESKELYEIAVSWLAQNQEDTIHIDMRKLTTTEEACRLLWDYAKDISESVERVVRY